MLQTDVGGRVQLRKVQGLLAGSDKQLQTALAKNTREAVAPIKREIPAEAQVRMPTRYGTVLAKAVKVSARVTAGTTIKAVVKIAAKGKKEPRDIKALDKGVLRHPLFGNRKHWYGPPGPPFLGPALDARSGEAMAKYAKKIDRMLRQAGWK